MITPRNVHQSLKKRIVTVPIAALAAGVDAADIALLRCPCALEITDVHIIPQAAGVGIDAANTSAWLIEYSTTSLASATFAAAPAFPAAGVATQLTLTTTVASRKRAEGDVITYSITNGTTAATPATIVQIEYMIIDEAFSDTVHATNYAT